MQRSLSPYQGYTYSYPHKSAYRPLDPPVELKQVWAEEDRSALFLYVHVPFCEMRCGFCNLFTTSNPEAGTAQRYLTTLARQTRQVREALRGEAGFARMAIGGGTPTFLEAHELELLFETLEKLLGVAPPSIPVSVETSPQTATSDRMKVLRSRGVDRVSMGVQSFVEAEVLALGRAQKNEEVCRAIENIRAMGFPTLNLDLIYGGPGQTVASWTHSLRQALQHELEELYLYPLYVRPLTGLQRRRHVSGEDLRLDCYRAARDLLFEHGYEQVSMRMFRREGRAADGTHVPAPVYCCQDDGMIGLGCGARSYTRGLHYSTEFAVKAGTVRGIIDEYLEMPDEAFAQASHGAILDLDDQRRRWAAKSLLQVRGLELDAYRIRFGSDVTEDVAELSELVDEGFATVSDGWLQLTAEGLEMSDAIGPRLYSARVQTLMAEYAAR